MIEISLFTKYETMKVVPTGALFDLPLLETCKTHKCAYCGLKLYEMRNRPMYYCKSKRCPNLIQNKKQFVISKSKLK